MSEKRTRRRRQRNVESACVGLSKKRCAYPCKGVKKHKGSSEFGHCQSMFFKKKNKMDKRTQRIVRECIRKGRQSEKKEKHLRKKSGDLKVTGDKAIEKAVVLEQAAEVVGDEKKGYLTSATDALSMATGIFGSSTAPVNEEPTIPIEEEKPVEPTPFPEEDTREQEEEATPADATPADATPADATPADATPADATPADATPADATPADAEKKKGEDL